MDWIYKPSLNFLKQKISNKIIHTMNNKNIHKDCLLLLNIRDLKIIGLAVFLLFRIINRI
jgi:hypothetical protein